MIHHNVYSFDPVQFHRDLERKIIKKGEFQPALLRELATHIVAQPSFAARKDLHDDIRFGYHESDLEHWFGESDDLENTINWYILALANELQPSLSISIVSHIVLKSVLPLAGWEERRINHLLDGTDLNTLVQKYGNELLWVDIANRSKDGKIVNNFSVGISGDGGWLDIPELHNMLQELSAAKKYIIPESEESIKAIDENMSHFQNYYEINHSAFLKNAYEEVLQMLQTAIDREHTLFICFD